MRSKPRLDGNHKEIVEALLGVGASVQSLASIGCGCPDLLVGFRQKNYVIEIKTDSGGLEVAQEKWLGEWNGHATIVRNADGALRAIGASR